MTWKTAALLWQDIKSGTINPTHCIAFVLLVIITTLAIQFVAHDVLGTFADDSVSYLIMAQQLSPFFSTSQHIIDAAAAEKYPPVFPLVLALTGTSHNFLAGHILVACLFACVLVALYFLARRILHNNITALLVTLLFALCPSAWLNMLGILSENLYILVTLVALLFFERFWRDNNPTILTALGLGTLFSLVLLTRSIGISLIAAYIVTDVFKYKSLRRLLTLNNLIPIVLPTLLALLWHYVRPTTGPDLYASDVGKVIMGIFAKGDLWTGLTTLVGPQLAGLYMSWFTAFLLYWQHEWQINFIIIVIFACLVLTGLIKRLIHNQFDAWYVLFYLMIVMVWPYSEQTGRFLYPVLPLLFIYGGTGLIFIATKISNPRLQMLAPNLGILIVLAVVLPTLAFFQSRAQYHTEIEHMDFSRVMLFYNYPHLSKAKEIALHHEHLRQDMDFIKASTEAEATIMWYTPNYITLLADRKAVRFPRQFERPAFLHAIKQSGADYVFAARLNPRYTSEKFNGLAITPYFQDFTSVVWSRKNPQADEILSVLLKIDYQKLDQLIQDSQQ